MRFELMDLGIGTIRFSSWRGLYFSGGFVFILFSIVMWFVEKPLMSLMEEDSATIRICERLPHRAEPRLNISVNADGNGLSQNCRAQLEAYIPKNAELGSASGTIEFFEGPQPLGESSPVHLSLRDGGTGMKSAEIALPPAAGKACRNLRLELELARCFSSTGQKIACPQIRIAENLDFQDFKVGGEDLRVCYDE